MHCRRCGSPELLLRRRRVTDARGVIVIHHECRRIHLFHGPADDPDGEQSACPPDCPARHEDRGHDMMEYA